MRPGGSTREVRRKDRCPRGQPNCSNDGAYSRTQVEALGTAANSADQLLLCYEPAANRRSESRLRPRPSVSSSRLSG